MKRLLLPLFVLLACQKEGTVPTPAPPTAPPPAPVAAVGQALYRVTLLATWSKETHADFPGGAHFSPLIGLAHRATNTLFDVGMLASPGMQDMAEVGNNAKLRAEIAALRGSGAAFGWLDGRIHTLSPGKLVDTVRLDAAHPRLTVVTMIAPSPDWFVALENRNLLVDGQWVQELSVPAITYDAGTDSGPTFTALNQPTLPAEPIKKLVLPLAPGSTIESVATWQLERIK